MNDTDRKLRRANAKRIESAGNLVSDLGEHGLANQLWALAGEILVNLRRIAPATYQDVPNDPFA